METDYSCDNFILLFYEKFSIELFLCIPSCYNENVEYVGELKKFIFLYGDKDEIYSEKEINFLNIVKSIIVFKSEKLRIIVVRSIEYETLDFTIIFTKIIAKAFANFNICVIVSKNGIFFTCADNIEHYIISNYIKNQKSFYSVINKLSEAFIDDINDFYENVFYAIDYKNEECYDENNDDENNLNSDFNRKDLYDCWNYIINSFPNYEDFISYYDCTDINFNDHMMLCDGELSELINYDEKNLNDNLENINVELDNHNLYNNLLDFEEKIHKAEFSIFPIKSNKIDILSYLL